jgi:nitroreductase
VTNTKFNPKNAATYDLLMRRRSVKARDMKGPDLSRATVEQILQAGMRVPDHGKLAPWRFLVLVGDERAKLGDLIARGLVAEKETSDKVAEKMKSYATQGPVLIVAIHSPRMDHPVPLWEQQLSLGAACQNMLVAATALGLASQWLTGWASYSPTVTSGLGLSAEEKIAGFLFFGNHGDKIPSERPRPVFEDHVSWGLPN